MKRVSLGCLAALAFILFAAAAWSAPPIILGPGQLPDWQAEAQVKVGWVFDDPTNPQNFSPLPGWEQYFGDVPTWDYDPQRVMWGQPAQWYVRIENLVNQNPVKQFWISWVYSFDPFTSGPRAFTNMEWSPFVGYGNFTRSEEWFDVNGNPTTNHLNASYARITISLDMYPNPPYEDVYLGTASGSMMAMEVYIMTECLEGCMCDLHEDGKCDMQDWLVFGVDWGRTDCFQPGVEPCECDLNQDGRCDMQDFLLFGQEWGRTDCPHIPIPE